MLDKEVLWCYHCGHKSACEIKGVASQKITSLDENFPIVGYENYPVHADDYEFTEADYDIYTVEYRTGLEELDYLGCIDLYAEKKWRLIQCLTCSQPMLEMSIKVFSKDCSPEMDELEEYELPIVPEVKILYPIDKIGDTPKPIPHMPKDVEEVFTEARTVFANSPRASAALLRLALQLLCKHLGQPGKDINEDIKALAKQGLPLETRQAMDIVRVLGNYAVHPGEINLNDNPKKVSYLFNLINYIVIHMIIRPSQINELYEVLPEDKRKAIEERDSKRNNGRV